MPQHSNHGQTPSPREDGSPKACTSFPVEDVSPKRGASSSYWSTNSVSKRRGLSSTPATEASTPCEEEESERSHTFRDTYAEGALADMVDERMTMIETSCSSYSENYNEGCALLAVEGPIKTSPQPHESSPEASLRSNRTLFPDSLAELEEEDFPPIKLHNHRTISQPIPPVCEVPGPIPNRRTDSFPSPQRRPTNYPPSPSRVNFFQSKGDLSLEEHFRSQSRRRLRSRRSLNAKGGSENSRSSHHRIRRTSSGVMERRNSKSSTTVETHISLSSSEEHSSSTPPEMDLSSSSRSGRSYPRKLMRRKSRRRSQDSQDERKTSPPKSCSKSLLRLLQSRQFVWILLMIGLTSATLTVLAAHNMVLRNTELESLQHPNHVNVLYRQSGGDDQGSETTFSSAGEVSKSSVDQRRQAGLRGNMLHEVVVQMEKEKEPVQNKENDGSHHFHKNGRNAKKKGFHHHTKNRHTKNHRDGKKPKKRRDERDKQETVVVGSSNEDQVDTGRVLLPAGKLEDAEREFEVQDPRFYQTVTRGKTNNESRRRIALLESSGFDSKPAHREVELYPADFTDYTQLYATLDSHDERIKTMERREPLAKGECVPMQDWQSTFHPSCNGMHEVDLAGIGENNGDDFKLFGTKGFWRNAWRVDSIGGHGYLEERDTIVLKTLKIHHRFEEAHFEHDRVDAVGMERLTASPHVINIFSYCGHSVMTEYADGKRLGDLADKSRKTRLARLRIARDIASGVADVHGIDGEGNATFVHLDINPANVVSVQGTLKLNDFNIGILRRWNTTSNTPCGFPAQYPNPQWRSPEEARKEQNLTEKVDVFSMGHIFFRLICGHEPWNKLEPRGRPSKEEVNDKVIKGILPYIPDEVRTSTDPEVVAIREAMFKCYTYNPEERPSARMIAGFLQETLDGLESVSAES